MAKNKEKVQPEVNIGLVGHVDHGKTTLTKALSGKWTDTHSEEVKRGITIRLGYADTFIKECTKCKDSQKYTTQDTCSNCGGQVKKIRKISLVDAPGHESLMATMLSGASMMDGALLLISANETCPQPQTREHLSALEISGIKNIIIVQNKIDSVSIDRAQRNYQEIQNFVKGTVAQNSPIIPISALHNVNIDMLLEKIQEIIPTPERNPKDEPIMHVARSFDINKPGSQSDVLVGGILGGALIQGKFKIGDKIEIRPGRKIEHGGKIIYKPIETEILSLQSGSDFFDELTPGGSMAIMTKLDPSIVKSDMLTGSVVGHPGNLPEVIDKLTLKTDLLERVVGAQEELTVEPIRKLEPLMLNINSAATVGIVTDLSKNKVSCTLKLPICAQIGDRVTISRRVGQRFRLIGYGIIE